MKKIMIVIVASALLAMPGIFPANVPAEQLTIREMVANDVRYVTGCVGLDERKAMEKMAKTFNLKIVFAKMSGNYLARIPFTISKTDGERVLAITADGPWALVDLPAGAYTVAAEYDGTKRSQTLRVGAGLTICMFHWKS